MPIHLAAFLRQQRQAILEAWEVEVRRLPAAQALDRTALRNHLPQLLERIADWLARPRQQGVAEGLGDIPDVHALERLGEGFDLRQVVTEYRLLRGCVLRLWAQHGGAAREHSTEAAILFQEAIDEAVAASVARYTQARERTLQGLDRISAAALGSADLGTFLPRLLRVLRETVVVVDSVVVLLREGEALRVVASEGLPEEAPSFRLRLGEGFAGTVAATGKPLLLHDATTDPLVKSHALRAAGIRTLYGVPLLVEGEVLGVAHMGSRAHEFSDEDLLLFRTMAARATGLIAQTQAHARERAARAEAEQSLARLRESEAGRKRWEDIFNRLGVGVVLVRASDDVMEDLNPAYARMHGYTREELLGQPLVDLFAPESRGALPRHAAAARSKPHHEYEALHLRKDGSRFPAHAHITSLRDERGEVVLRAGTVMDITQRRAAEAERQRLLGAIEAERARLSAVLEQLPAGVILAEAPSGRLLMGNRRVEEILGHAFRPSGSMAEYAADYRGFHLDGRPYASEEWPMARSLLHGEVVRGEEIEIERGDGSRCTLIVSSAPIKDREGRIVAGVTTFVDITERRRAEAAVHQAARFGERLIAIVSHDLRNPLNAIQLSATQLLHSEALPAREQRAAARISKAAERMRRMIEELLDFTRGRLGGGIPIHPEPMDLRQLVRQGVEELEAASPERALRLHVEGGDFQVRGDADRLAQVVSNLGGNALQYSPPDTPITFSLKDGGEQVVLEVHNQGTPIPPDALATIFDPFRRARGESGGEGLGLGLYIVEQVVKGHGGHLEVTSTAQAGTTFRATLPRVPPG